MKPQSDTSLEAAIQAMKADQPEDSQVITAAQRLAGRLGIESPAAILSDTIRGCSDVQQMLPAYHAGAVAANRALVIEAHLKECSMCRSVNARGGAPALVDWSTPRAAKPSVIRPRALAWGLAAAAAMLVTASFVYRVYWQIPPGVRAQVESVDGSAYRINAAGGDDPVGPGSVLKEGEELRTSGGGHAVVRLSDGSRVEVNQRSEFSVGARGHNMTIALDNGAVIVRAAKRSSGHLYIKTPDCRVAVTGTVFSVDSGIKGSRVAVIEGTVHVLHAGMDTVMHAGDQVTTSDNLSPVPVEQQIAWSRDRDQYLVLLAQFSTLQHRLEQIPLPDAKYTSDLLPRVPADTLLYVSVPNLGEFVSQANSIFHDQLEKSPALQQWWNRGHNPSTAELDTLVEKLHGMSQYLGDEIVLVGLNNSTRPEVAVVADLKQGGLAEFLKTEMPASDPMHGFIVLGPQDLASSSTAGGQTKAAFALVREHEVVFSGSLATLRRIHAQLDSGASGFAGSEFGQQIAAAYERGSGFILAADLHEMTSKIAMTRPRGKMAALDNSGMSDMRYLIAEHRETNGETVNHLNLHFAGARQGVASWLGSPAPIGSLDFVTPNASLVVALLTKDPSQIVDDMIAMATKEDGSAPKGLSEAEEKLQINLRDDLAATLGGDALLALDGPVLPTPSWKAVIEVRDSEHLEKTLERLVEASRNQPTTKNQHEVAIEWKDLGAQRYYTVRDVKTGTEVANYTFADGYMILAPNRALLMEALHAHTVGDTLARSSAFKALLPKDTNENYSAVAYQNLSPVLTPLLSQVGGQAAVAVQQLAADSKPTAVCAWGQESGIEAASNSKLFGFDFLTLGSLMKDWNQHGSQSVRDSHGSN